MAETPTIDLRPGAASRRELLAELLSHRAVLWILTRKDFHTRYKRAALGILWAVVVPVVQGVVLTVVFSRFVPVDDGVSYGAYVLSGVLPWAYFASSTSAAATSIVDGSSLTDKIWFPRAILPLVSCASGLVGLGISMVILLVAAPVLGADVGVRLLLLAPACALLFAFTSALGLVLAALNVYFRDVRFIVAAALLVLIYATPILYQQSAVDSLGPWLDANPMTGVVSLFHEAVGAGGGPLARSVTVAVVATGVLTAVAVEVYRRHDRLFVDLL